ncbi:hypothetical protein ACSQ76_06880 [Roseovarius sp. B08]|uniref:hypothetical protein n=1 Tax=Roseovarius sp. B08 TaxID=3449223 RepID=UPI003EDC0376
MTETNLSRPPAPPSPTAGLLDQSNVTWNTLEGFDHVWYHILKVDPDAKTVDLLLKFAANQRILLHRHHADYSTLILQGELRLYDASGTLTEIRPTLSFVEKPAGGPRTAKAAATSTASPGSAIAAPTA